MPQNENIAREALSHALQCGCSAVRVSLYHNEDNSIDFHNGELENINSSVGRQLNITFYVDGRFSTVTTNMLDRDEVMRFVEEGVRSSRLLAPDPLRSLPPKSDLYRGPADNLGLYDESYAGISAEERIAKAGALAERMAHPRMVSAALSLSDGVEHCFIATSDGFEGRTASTYFAVSAMACLRGNGDERAEDSDFFSTHHWSELDADSVVANAVCRAEKKIGPSRIDSGMYDILVDRTVAGRLFSPLLQALSGAALYHKSSFLAGMQNERIASPLLSICDNPAQRGRQGAALFGSDGERVPAMPVFEDGVLRNYYISYYFGKKLEAPPTRERPLVLDFALSEATTDAMLRELRRGVYITDFNGGNCNASTGDFSFGISGFLVENGVVVKPISEMLLTGNMLAMWNCLAGVSSDPLPYTRWSVPTLLFSKQTLN